MVGEKKTNLRAGFFYILLFFQLCQFLGKEFKGDLWVGLSFGCFHKEACEGLICVTFTWLEVGNSGFKSGKDLVDDWNQDSWIWDLNHACFFHIFTRTAAIFSQVDKDFLGRSWALQEGYGIEANEKIDFLIWMIIKLYYTFKNHLRYTCRYLLVVIFFMEWCSMSHPTIHPVASK